MWRASNRCTRGLSPSSTNHTSSSSGRTAIHGESIEKQIVALGDDQGDVGIDNDGIGNRSACGTVIARRSDHFAGRLAAETIEESDIFVDVEGVGGSLSAAPAEPDEVVVQQVKPVHWHHRARRHASGNRRRQRRLTGTGAAGDAEQGATSGCQHRGAPDRLVDRQFDHERVGLHMSLSSPRCSGRAPTLVQLTAATSTATTARSAF